MGQEARKLFIGNLNYKASEDELRAFFVEHGYAPTKVTIPLDKETGNPRGFGFVELETADDAQRAIGDLHQAMFLGRSMHVDIAKDPPRPREHREPRQGGFQKTRQRW